MWDGVSQYDFGQGVTAIEALSDVVVGDTYSARNFYGPDPVQPSQDQLAAALATRRYNVCNGGMTFNGIPLATDEATRSTLTAARILSKEDSSYSVNWKAGGSFVTLNAATIIAIADAVAAFVQKCFDSEAAVLANISQYTSIAQVNAAFDAAMAA
jgi:hypothetical protein